MRPKIAVVKAKANDALESTLLIQVFINSKVRNVFSVLKPLELSGRIVTSYTYNDMRFASVFLHNAFIKTLLGGQTDAKTIS